MFVYEKKVDGKETLNIAFKAKKPVENPDIVVEETADGAKITVNGETIAVETAD